MNEILCDTAEIDINEINIHETSRLKIFITSHFFSTKIRKQKIDIQKSIWHKTTRKHEKNSETRTEDKKRTFRVPIRTMDSTSQPEIDFLWKKPTE